MSNLMHWVWQQRDLSVKQKFILAFLAWEDQPITSTYDIADFTNIHPAKIRPELDELVNAGLLSYGPAGDGFGGTQIRFALNFETEAA